MKNRKLLLLAIIGLTLTGFYFLQVMAVQATAVAFITPPDLDLNGADGEGKGHTAFFTEDEGAILVTDTDLTLTDPDSTHMFSATISLINRPNGNDESLSAIVVGTLIQANYNPTSGILQLTQTDTITNYRNVLATVRYNNISNAPADTSDRTVRFIISDGTNNSAAVESLVSITAINDAPILNNSATMTLTSILEDNRDQIGNTVATIIASTGTDTITDPDGNGLPEGLAITEAASSNGTWQYSTNAGTNWLNFGAVSNTSAVLLNTSSRIRFVPQPDYNGQASITFRAWDQTIGMSGDTGVNVVANGGSTPFSAATGTALLDIIPVNDPPQLDVNGALTGTHYTTSLTGKSGNVSIIATDATLDDVDSSTLVSATVTLISHPDGVAEFLAATNISTTINILPYNSAKGTLQIEGSASINDYRQVMHSLIYSNTASSITGGDRIIEFIINDGNDDSTIVTTTVIVQPNNSAPILDPTKNLHLTEITEDQTNPLGNSVATIIANADSPPISDNDFAPLSGFAIVGADNSDGSWQYSVDDGSNWINFGAISDSSAVLLNPAGRIRFVPNPNFSGNAGNLTIRAWDQTMGANGSSGVDVTVNGDTTAFSSATAPVAIFVQSVNDQPVLTFPGSVTINFTEGDGPVTITGPSLNISDVDNDKLTSATAQITNYIPNEPDILRATITGTTLDQQYADGTLTLTGSGTLATYQMVMRSITYTNSSQDPLGMERIVAFKVNDGTADSNVVISTITVHPINDAPNVDLNGAEEVGNNNVAYFEEGTESTAVAPALELQDLDNTALIGAVVTLKNRPDGNSNERLSATSQGNIVVSAYNPNSGQITLSGQGSIGDYASVLRSVTYHNSVATPHRASRIIEFVVNDEEDSSELATSTIIIKPQYILLPIIFNNVIIEDEPNDLCQQAFPIALNTVYDFEANDKNDWYYFELDSPQNVTVRLTNFVPAEGQIIVASGTCTNPILEGNNGNFSPTKLIPLGVVPKDRYYIWIISDNPGIGVAPYNLKVEAK